MGQYTKNGRTVPREIWDAPPPQDLDAEQSLLGSMLLSRNAIDEVADLIQPSHFYSDAHVRIAKVIFRLAETRTGGIDAVTVGSELAKRGEIEEIGGPPYLVRILETVPHAEHARYYAEIVREKFEARRQLAERISEVRTILETSKPIGANDPQEWPPIDSLENRDLPPFPTNALPDVLRQWVEEESRFTQTPPDLAGLLSLAVCSATIARRVEVDGHPGWREPVNLFVLVLLDPANRKSAVFSDAVKPLEEIEKELIEAARPRVAAEQSDRRQKESQLKSLEKRGATDAHESHQARQLAAELATTPVPALPCLIIDEATEEVIPKMLSEQGGRIASLSPEGGVFDLMAGKYNSNGGTNFNVYLKAHAGENPRSDRISRESIRVERPALTCGYAIQPAVIKGLAETPAFRGRGLLARFLYAVPRSWIGTRRIAPPPVSEATQAAYRQLIRTLAETEGETVLTLTPAAESLLMDWEANIEEMLGDGGELEMVKDWGGKLAGATLRLAAVIHCVIHHGPAGQISDTTLMSAISLGTYLIPHAQAALDLMGAHDDATDDDARYVLTWITRHAKREFTKTEAQHHGKRRFPKAHDIDPALATLVKRNYIRQRPAPKTGPGRPPSPTYETNPAVFDSPEKRSQYSENHSRASDSPSLPNIGSAFERSQFEREER